MMVERADSIQPLPHADVDLLKQPESVTAAAAHPDETVSKGSPCVMPRRLPASQLPAPSSAGSSPRVARRRRERGRRACAFRAASRAAEAAAPSHAPRKRTIRQRTRGGEGFDDNLNKLQSLRISIRGTLDEGIVKNTK